MQLRAAQLADVPALAQLARTTFSENFRHYAADDLAHFFAEFYSDQVFLSYIHDPSTTLKVVENAGALVAYVKFGACKLPVILDANTIELHRLYVLALAQGQGLGRMLMEDTLAEARESGAEEMLLGVWEKNIRAQKFYSHYGFEKIGEYNYTPIGNIIDREWILAKVL